MTKYNFHHFFFTRVVGKHSALIGDIEVEKVSDNESSDSEEEEDRSGKFDFGPPLLFSGDSVDLDSLPENIKSRMETITIRRQMVGKLGQFIIKERVYCEIILSKFTPWEQPQIE